MADRARARQLASQFHAKGDPTGWFDRLYCEAERGETQIPWADLFPNPKLVEVQDQLGKPGGQFALTIGCGLGDDAEQLAAWGFQTIAFDISAAAVRACRRRFPESQVDYAVADLLNPPSEWTGRFDLVLESYTVQVLPPHLHAVAIRRVVELVRPGGRLLLIARLREKDEPEGEMPWPLTRSDVQSILDLGFEEISFEEYFDDEAVRRFRALFRKTVSVNRP